MFKFFRGRAGKNHGKPDGAALPASSATPLTEAPLSDIPPSDRVYQKGEQLSADEKRDLRAQALANAKAAREAIGSENLEKIIRAMQNREASPMEQARKILLQMDQHRLNDELLAMIRDRERLH